ncbi:HsdM family class I SAM-dependent methyltransferase [Alicyclobacillus sp. ALC3]|uniref:HsdM family class I SAM-dependent methyltransferase n=1 Tax=Alicyclobacillus sp. ALC3 TaxID=2796143 RepID=UPI0023799AD4|nr:N-6 DNA methylase [Alicyclobacillus sp. ALC3]WDL99713.1 N-6 DNA methylase [Alicyclobacillus sp. ALC3]
MTNERITENLVRDKLRELGYMSQTVDTVVEEQKSHIEEVKRLLKGASKSGNGGKGSPEFIISSPSSPDFLVIVECKASTRQHESTNRNRPIEYAVDGALHYASALSRAYNIIALGVSGQSTEELKVSCFLWAKGALDPKPFTNEHGRDVETILPFDDFIRLGSFDSEVSLQRHEDLMAFSRELHEFMRDHAKLTESQKPLLVSGTLIALRNTAFAKSYDEYTPEELQRQWMHVIRTEIEKADIPNTKKPSMVQPYSSIAVHPELGKSTPKYPKGVLHELIRRLNEKVWPFVSVYHDFDVVGQFYGEFLKYTGGDKKSLGIVLTPRHVTELFALLANLSVRTDQQNGQDVVVATKMLDICAGTAGFLISGMQQMMRVSSTESERKYIREHCLVGVEQQPDMYALAASNMILRGDGKANLYQGSCFDSGITKAIKSHKCNVGVLNPPYSQSDEELHELVFVNHMLNCIQKGGTGIAIVPMSCAISPHTMRETILKHHTLEAVMSMPDELFYPVGVITCIMVFTAGVPHKVSKRKTWFGYWKHDGFVKTKNKGRIDLNGAWPSIRDRWLEQYRNREVVPGESVSAYVTHEDEWCAEAFMETDYGRITEDVFQQAVQKYIIYRMLENASRRDGDSIDEEVE